MRAIKELRAMKKQKLQENRTATTTLRPAEPSFESQNYQTKPNPEKDEDSLDFHGATQTVRMAKEVHHLLKELNDLRREQRPRDPDQG